MAEQGELPGMAAERDPKRYRELSQPFATRAEALNALEAFVEAVKAARIQHKIPDIVVSFTFSYVTDDGEELESGVALNMGDGMKAESIAAFAHGKMAEQRRDSVARAMKLATRR
jgi:hypothetical protein